MYLKVHNELESPWLWIQNKVVVHRLQSPRMEITAQKMHGSLRGDVREWVNLESFSTPDHLKLHFELGKVVVISLYVAQGKELIRQ